MAALAANAWIRSDTPGRQLCTAIGEWNGATVVGENDTRTTSTSTSSWTQLPTVTYTATGTGPLETYVLASGVTTGDSFDIDDVLLERR